jgi:hypothetical protein
VKSNNQNAPTKQAFVRVTCVQQERWPLNAGLISAELCEIFPHTWFTSYFILNKDIQGYTFTSKYGYVAK